MTKIKEELLFDETEKKVVVKETHDYTPVLDRARALRSAGMDGMDKNRDNRLVGLVPLKLFYQWAKEAGVDPTDGHAMQEVLARNLHDRDNSQFRVWEGTF